MSLILYKKKLGDVACTIHHANTTETYKSHVYVLGLPGTGSFNRCDYCAVQMKHTVVCGSARTGNYLILAMKKKSQHFKGDTTVAGRLLVHTRHEEIYGRQSLHSHPVQTPPAFDGVVLRKYVGYIHYLVHILAIFLSNGVSSSNETRSQ